MITLESTNAYLTVVRGRETFQFKPIRKSETEYTKKGYLTVSEKDGEFLLGYSGVFEIEATVKEWKPKAKQNQNEATGKTQTTEEDPKPKAGK